MAVIVVDGKTRKARILERQCHQDLFGRILQSCDEESGQADRGENIVVVHMINDYAR